MKALIFDSGTLINLTMNGLLDVLEKLKRNFDGKFLITKQVKYETIDHPLMIQRFELGALQVQNLLERGIIETPESLSISDSVINDTMNILLNKANHLLQVRGRWVNLVSEGEMSCLGLSKELSKRNIENMIAIDERTTRILCENPSNLERLMSEKLHQRVHQVEADIIDLKSFRFIRSSEILFVAYKKGLIDIEGKKVLEALLYATKFKGSSISLEEIDILKKM